MKLIFLLIALYSVNAFSAYNKYDIATNSLSSVDSEMMLYSGTSGVVAKRATGSGLCKVTSGVFSVATAGTDYLTVLSGDVTTSGNAATLANTAVIPGSYTSADITVDSKGRVTAAANGSGGSGTTKAAAFTCGTGSADANTLTLLTFDSSTLYNYAPGSPASWSNTGTISSAQTKFGPTTLLIGAGSSQSASHAGGAEVNLGSGDFTIDFWLWTGAANTGGVFGNYTANAAGNIIFSIGSAGANQFYYFNGVNNYFTPTVALTYNQFNHFALVRSGTTLTLYINGVAATATVTDAVDYTTVGNANTFHVGYAPGTGASGQQYVDEFRISNSARWTSNFTPPTAPYAVTNTITTDSTSMITSVSGGSGLGVCTVAFTGGAFATTPVCNCTAVNATANSICSASAAATTSGISLQALVSGAAANSVVNMTCTP